MASRVLAERSVEQAPGKRRSSCEGQATNELDVAGPGPGESVASGSIGSGDWSPSVRWSFARMAADIPRLPSLLIGAVNDPLEREADAMASQAMGGSDVPPPTAVRPAEGLQRKCAACKAEEDEEHQLLTRKEAGSGHSGPHAPPIVHQVLQQNGTPLDSRTRAFLEPRFHWDFSRVRVHTGAQASESAKAINARAFTVNHHIVFADGEYKPHSRSDLLLAHELSHVIQQEGTPGRWRSPVQSLDGKIRTAMEPTTPNTADFSPAPPMIRRAVADRTAAATADVPAPVRQAESPTPARGLIVEDDAGQVGRGQMKKSDFLAQLRTEICAAADAILAASGRSTKDCPDLQYWLDYYSHQDSGHLEQAIRRYAPEAARAAAAHDYIRLIVARVSRAVSVWAATGKVTGVPAGISAGMPSATARGGSTTAPDKAGGVQLKARDGGGRSPGNLEAIQSQLSAGKPLDGTLQSHMESAFGYSFSRVRIHTDARAAGVASNLNARAFTIGNDIAFGAGEYAPGSLIGDALIAHELAHVVQQQDSAATVQRDRAAELEAEADVSAAGAIAGLWGAGGKFLARKPTLRSGLRLSRCGRPAEEKIPYGKSKQRYWREQFKEKYPQLEGIGQVAGTRDEGVMTETGIRVPLHKGDFLLPRKFYEVKDAEFAVYQGYIHYAELIEAGHGGQAVVLSQTYGAPFVPDDKLDLEHVVGWSRNAELARRGVEMFVAAGETAQTYRGMAAERAAARDVPVPKKESVIVQGEGTDPTVVKSTNRMAQQTGQRVVTLGKGALKDVDEITVIAHGNQTLVKIGNRTLTPKQFAKELADSGFEGGTVRLAACKTAGCDPMTGKNFAQELSKELTSLGKESAVIGSPQKVSVPPATQTGGGVPRARTSETDPTLQAPGKGWEIYVE